MKLSLRHYGIILAILATALLHLSLFFELENKLDPVFLNGFGYLALLGAYFLPVAWFQQRHRTAWYALFGYTLLTFILWVILGNKHFVWGTYSATGYFAKIAEIFAMSFLWADRPRAASAPAVAHSQSLK
ncbi:MAG: hypothetical protein ACM3QS_07060 [Bacteroidota bacterium]